MKKLFRDIEIEAMNKNELLSNLRTYGAKGINALNKPELIERLKKLVNREIDFPSESKVNVDSKFQAILQKRTIFDKAGLVWSPECDSHSIPTGFSIMKIHNFLTEDSVLIGDEELDAGTEKPAIKGRQLYLSAKIQFWEYCKDNDLHLFRANISASMKQEV